MGPGLFEVASVVWEAIERGDKIPLLWRARVHSMANHGIQLGRESVSRLFTAGSVDAVHEGHGLERTLHDVHGFSVQWERYRHLHFEAGRVLLGAEPQNPQF